MLSPATYPCSLCYLTYGRYGVKNKSAWLQFIRSLPYDVLLLHRDELLAVHPEQQATQLPAVFTRIAGDLKLFIGANKNGRLHYSR
jgi:hypothetical protein